MYRIKEKKLYMDREWMCQRYLEEKCNLVDIALECGVSQMTVHRWLRKLDIPIRERSESVALGKSRKFPNMDKEWLKKQENRIREAERKRAVELLEKFNESLESA